LHAPGDLVPRYRDFRRLRNLEAFPQLTPYPFDPREKTFNAELSIENRHISSVSAEKIVNIGIKVYGANAQETADATPEDAEYDTVAFNQGFEDPGATFGTVTVPRGGAYDITVSTEWESNDTGRRSTLIEINGTAVEGDVRHANNTSRSTVHATRVLEEGDTIGVNYTQTSTGALDVNGGEDDRSLTVMYRGMF
jgi:hypothetical protein